MNKRWQLQEAKNKLSDLVERVQKEGPQTITRRGEDAAVLVSSEYFKRFFRSKGSLVEFFKQSPLHGVTIDVERSQESGRKVKV